MYSKTFVYLLLFAGLIFSNNGQNFINIFKENSSNCLHVFRYSIYAIDRYLYYELTVDSLNKIPALKFHGFPINSEYIKSLVYEKDKEIIADSREVFETYNTRKLEFYSTFYYRIDNDNVGLIVRGIDPVAPHMAKFTHLFVFQPKNSTVVQILELACEECHDGCCCLTRESWVLRDKKAIIRLEISSIDDEGEYTETAKFSTFVWKNGQYVEQPKKLSNVNYESFKLKDFGLGAD